ncbi:hypothetical protein [Salinicoccus roseus]|uniref:hypothetical protein n=1 Tax=Salinicoccus roseus TaxID=45670 RepID=UPI003DA1C09A
MRFKDEMEKTITNKALKISWTITIVCLFLAGGYEFLKHNQEMNLFLVIAIISAISLIVTEQYYLAQTNEDKSFKKFIITVIAVIILLMVTLFFLTGL